MYTEFLSMCRHQFAIQLTQIKLRDKNRSKDKVAFIKWHLHHRLWKQRAVILRHSEKCILKCLLVLQFRNCFTLRSSDIVFNLPQTASSINFILIIKANEMQYFSKLFDKVIYMFRTGPLSIIRSILIHCGRVTQICVFTLQLCKTDDANLRF